MFDRPFDAYSFVVYSLFALALLPFLVAFVFYFALGFKRIYTLYVDSVFKFFGYVFNSVFGGDR